MPYADVRVEDNYQSSHGSECDLSFGQVKDYWRGYARNYTEFCRRKSYRYYKSC